MKRLIYSKYVPLLFIAAVVFIFFAKLIFPPSVFTTPDFGRSDALHLNLPLKLLLSEDLKNFRLPLWKNGSGQGFTPLAESIIGAFYLPNLIIFSILPFAWAIPAMYITTFITAAIATYFLCRKLNLQKGPSAIAAISYSFCAPMMLHLQHFNFTQSASLLPLLIIWLLNFFEKRSVKNALVCSLIFSQMLFAGFVQIFAYAVLLFSVFAISWSIIKKTSVTLMLALYTAIVLFSLSLSAVQLMPSYELIKVSNRSSGVQSDKLLNSFPLFPRNYLTYINPFINGKSSNGSNNSTQWSQNGIFWENTSYIGIISLLFYFFGLYIMFKKTKNNIFLAFFVLTVLAILLSLGKFSPLHIFFSFPPLNFFRVPARFILFVQFFAVLIAAYGLKHFQQKLPGKISTYVMSALVVLNAANFYYYWYDYNPTESTKSVLTPPEITRSIDRQTPNRILTISSPQWNQVFTKNGWQNQQSNYKFFRNALDQNINLLYGQNQFATFENLPTRRYSLQAMILEDGIKSQNSKISISKKAQNILKSSAVKYIISSQEIETENFTKVDEVRRDDFRFLLYRFENSQDIANIFYDTKIAKITNDYWQYLEENDTENIVILENLESLNLEKGTGRIIESKIRNGYHSFKLETDKKAVLAVSNSYYPGWEATIDKQKTDIYPANINSLAVVVPQGTHEVEFKYKPASFRLGLIISTTSHALILLFLLRKRLKILHWLAKCPLSFSFRPFKKLL